MAVPSGAATFASCKRGLSVLERYNLAFVRAGARDANRRPIKRRKKGRVRHIRSYLVEERLETEIDPGGRRCVVMRRQEKLGLEQLDEGPCVVDLRVSHRVHLIGDDGDIHRAEFFGKRPHARRDWAGAAIEHGLETRREDKSVSESTLCDHLGVERAERAHAVEFVLLLVRIGWRIALVRLA